MNVRLDPWEIKEIITSFKNCFQTGDHLWLFGSRTNLNKRGGDIDLYIEVAHFNSKETNLRKDQFWMLLQDRLGVQKIDIVLKNPSQDLLIYKVAQTDGVLLV